MRRPAVYLIGAGPGDPGLMTVHGLECLRTADAVVYDHLVPRRLLAHAGGNAELIDVGTASPQAMAQEAICYLLAEKVREGKVVVRLKWGDPFVFDRGGEEALFLHEQQVPFEVVPGIPAAIAVPRLRRGAGDVPWRRRHHYVDSRPRRREPHPAHRRLGQPGPAGRHRRLLCGRSPAPAHVGGPPLQRLASRRPGRHRVRRHAAPPGNGIRDDRGAARRAAPASAASAGHAGRRPGCRAAAASSLVRRPAALRPTCACHTAP